jgi:hypothetical protein
MRQRCMHTRAAFTGFKATFHWGGCWGCRGALAEGTSAPVSSTPCEVRGVGTFFAFELLGLRIGLIDLQKAAVSLTYNDACSEQGQGG